MNPERQQAITYLRAPVNGLWRWAEDGAVLVWRDGSTIAFREELAQIFERLAAQGLPSLGAIVFLLAACRGKIPSVDDIVVEANTSATTERQAAILFSARQQLKAQLASALSQLQAVSQLPAELNTGIKARCLLAEAVFEPARAERHVDARIILQGMKEPMSDADLTESEDPSVSGTYIRQIHIVAEGLKLHSAESLALRMRTGLDALPEELDLELPTAERARKLIEELSRDREFGAVARAARELMAAVRLPRRLGEREQLALGGVADITNRGPLDRLLLSELAHDDLTLAVRVALNEALYLRREPPMREPPGTLALLLDSSVRLWGVPRVLATAVALALVARDKQHSEVLAWRAHAKQLQTVDLLSRRGLTEHLGALETTAHSGAALPAFAEAVASGEQNQTVLITHRDALDDPEFRRALAEQPAAPGFVGVVDGAGRFELHALPLARRPPLCEADLDLATVFDNESGVAPIKIEADPNLPAIFGVRPFPFLLPLAGKVDCWTNASDGCTYAMLNDRRLVQFRDQHQGARELATDLPPGKTIWMELVDGTIHAVKTGASQRPARLVSYQLAEGQPRLIDLTTGPELLAVHQEGDTLLLIRNHDVRAYALSDGRLLGRVLNPLRWVHGRYFRGEEEFYFAAWDGSALKFEPVTLPLGIEASSVALIFDRRGLEGPWLLLRDGELVSTATDERYQLPNPKNLALSFNQAAVSSDGNQLRIPSATPTIHRDAFVGCVLGLKPDLKDTTVEFGPTARFLFNRSPALPTWNVFRVVESVTCLNDGLGILGRKNRWRKLVLCEPDSLRIVGLPERGPELWNKVNLTTPSKRTLGCLLQRAEWPCGSKVFLDSRGLLHLKSHDPSVPEISLVLSDGEVAGWTSDGHVCGPKFFFEGEFTSAPRLVFDRIMQFLKLL